MEKQNKITTIKLEPLMNLEQRRQKDLVLYSPSNCYKHSSKIRSIKDVLTLPSKTLGQFKRDFGKDWVVGYISMWLIDLNDKAQVKSKMNDSQMEFTAERIFETYSLRITDLTLFFRNVKEGVYGPYYENLSSEKIMEWLKQYYDLRCEYAQMQSQSNRTDWFKENTAGMSKEEIVEGLEIMFSGVGEEVIEHEKGEGSGTRYKNLVYANHKFRDKIMHEDELPEMTEEEYAEWFESSFLLDGVRVGKPFIKKAIE